MRKFSALGIVCMLSLIVFAGVYDGGVVATAGVGASFLEGGERITMDAYGLIGGVFVENRGQLENAEARYYLHLGSGGIAFSAGSVMLFVVEHRERSGMSRELSGEKSYGAESLDDSAFVRGNAVRLTFVGANNVVPVGRGQVSWYNNYFIGNDPDLWRTGVSNFREIVYENLWDGIDLVYSVRDGNLKYDFIVHPFADHAMIKVHVEGHHGLSVTPDNSLLIGMGLGAQNDILDTELDVFYADEADQKVLARFRLESDMYMFEIDDRDESRTLVIDPLVYSTLLGGFKKEEGNGIAVDNLGCAYVTGRTDSTDFPTTPGAFDATYGGDWSDVFVTKLSADGGSLVYSTYIGGDSTDAGEGIALDSSGFVYIVGSTASTDFPTTSGAFDTTLNGIFDVFVLKLAQDGGSLVYSTFLGGSSTNWGKGIAVDINEHAYVTGTTDSTLFPTTRGAYSRIHGGGSDAFVTKLAQNGGSLVYSTFLGSRDNDRGHGIAVDNNRHAYITGVTNSANFPTTSGAFDTTYNGGFDAFVVKLAQDGGSLVYSTFVGGGHDDICSGIAVENNGYAYITGRTDSTDFPTTSGAFDTAHNGGFDAFVVKLAHNGGSLVYSTFLGTDKEDGGNGIAVDSDGNAYVTGYTDPQSGAVSSEFPTTSDAYQVSPQGHSDAFVTKLNPEGDDLIFSTYLGGSGFDAGNDIVVDYYKNLYVVGNAATGFPTTSGAYQCSGGGNNAFIAKFSVSGSSTSHSPPSPPRNLQAIPGDGSVKLSWQIPADNGGLAIYGYRVYRGTSPGGGTLLTSLGNTLSYSDTGLVNNQTYYYMVSAVNNAGEGELSAEVYATPTGEGQPPPTPGDEPGEDEITPDGDEGGMLPLMLAEILATLLTILVVVGIAVFLRKTRS